MPDPAGLPPAVVSLAEAVADVAERARMVAEEHNSLLTDLADELRTPLASIDAWLDALVEGRVVADESTVKAVRAHTHALRVVASDIGDAVLAGGGPVLLELAQLPLGPIVVTACRLFRAQALDRGVRLAGEVEDDLPEALIDPDRMVDVLVRLLDNAVRHTPPQGEIIVAARRRPDRADRVVLSVTDTGDGLRPDVLPRLFERYYRADSAKERARGGRGLGLAVARALVTAHGGTLCAASDGPGEGATFAVELPAHHDDDDPASGTDPAREPPHAAH